MSGTCRGRSTRRFLLGAVALTVPAMVATAPSSSAGPTDPDGRIVFTSDADGDYDVWTMAADGTDLRNLTSAGEVGDGWQDGSPSWSPDGSLIAFVSDRAGGSDVFVMAADGSGLRPVTDLGPDDSVSSPDWSPDGTRLVFAGQREAEEVNRNEDHDIYVVGVDGSGLRNVSDGFEATAGQYEWEDMAPDWSPVDDAIVFSSARIVAGADYEGAFWRIVTMRPDGSDQVVVSDPNDPGNDPWPDEVPNHDEMPKWSPDGGWIVFATHQQPEQQWDVQIVRADGTGQQNVLPDEEWEDVFPTWAPSGTEILFTSNRTGDHTRAIYSTDVSAFVASSRTRLAAAATAVEEVGGVGRSEDPDWYARPACTLRGSAAADQLVGTADRDVICALDGDDTVDAVQGDDVVLGGPGDDVLTGSPGRDRFDGGRGVDRVSYQASPRAISATLADRHATGQGFDVLTSISSLVGSPFDDLLVGDSADNHISALAGADTVRGGAGADVLLGGAGADTLAGGPGLDSCRDHAITTTISCEG